jgi:hypothetical protein
VKINSSQLANLVVEVANNRFGSETFKRRQLMKATEQVVHQRGLWTPEDDELSGSAGTKSRGLAAIDYRFSDLAGRSTLVKDRYDHWRLASPKLSPVKEFVLPPSDVTTPPARIEARVQRVVRDTSGQTHLNLGVE